MGKGDKKSRRGKIFMGSYGVRRPRNKKGVVKYVAKVVKTKVEVPIAVEEKIAAKKVVAKKAPAPKKAPAAKKVSAKKIAEKKEK